MSDLCKSVNSFKEAKKNDEFFGEIILELFPDSGDRCFLISKPTRKRAVWCSDIDGYIFLDKRLFKENIFNFIKDHSYRDLVSEYFLHLADEIKNKFDIKDMVLKSMLYIMSIQYIYDGDCVLITTGLSSYFLEGQCDDVNKLILNKCMQFIDNIVEFLSKPEYYKDLIQEEKSRLQEDYEIKKVRIEQIKKDLKLLEKM